MLDEVNAGVESEEDFHDIAETDQLLITSV